MRTGTIVLLSGGMDSATLLYKALAEPGGPVRAISFDYGQRHSKELDAASALALKTGVEHRVADLRQVGANFMYGSSQTSPGIQVPEGHYADENMKITVVPNRNMIMLAIATAWAEATKSHTVAYAAHAGDHAIYPDCRPNFVYSVANTIYHATDGEVTLWTPFLRHTKAQILQEGLALKTPYELTWTCYKGGLRACGKCGTCVERLEAFALAGVKDPLLYETL